MPSECRGGCGRHLNRSSEIGAIEHELECVVLKLDAAKKAWYDFQKSSRNGDGHTRIVAEATLNALLEVPGVGELK